MELMYVVKGESVHVETKTPSSQTVVSAVRTVAKDKRVSKSQVI